jgi:hypothetical protein
MLGAVEDDVPHFPLHLLCHCPFASFLPQLLAYHRQIIDVHRRLYYHHFTALRIDLSSIVVEALNEDMSQSIARPCGFAEAILRCGRAESASAGPWL